MARQPDPTNGSLRPQSEMGDLGKILVVDDDSAIVALVQMALEDEGFEVLAAQHGAAALEILSRVTPRLILLDMRMPVMSGWEFAQAYRECPGRRAPIVVLTAGEAADKASQIAADGYLGKPFTLDQLLATVARFTA